jgi:predicted dehydrogenase
MGKAYVEDFVQAIIDNKEPSINVQEAIDVLNVVEAIYKSDIERKWVKVEK